MKTAHYIFTTWDGEAMAAGYDGAAGGRRQAAMVRRDGQGPRAPGESKVIDLSDWRAVHPDLFEEEPWDGMDWTAEEYGEAGRSEPAIPAPRPRRRRRAVMTAELVSTMSVVAAALALIVRVLTF